MQHKSLSSEEISQFKDNLLFCVSQEHQERLTPADRVTIAGASKVFVQFKTVTPSQAEMVTHIRAKLEGKPAINWGTENPDLV